MSSFTFIAVNYGVRCESLQSLSQEHEFPLHGASAESARLDRVGIRGALVFPEKGRTMSICPKCRTNLRVPVTLAQTITCE